MENKVIKKTRRKKISEFSLASQIAMFALVLSLLFPFLSGIFNQQVYKNIFLYQASESLNQTLTLVENNIKNTINLIDETSQALIANEEVSNILNYQGFTNNIEQRNRARNFIRNVLDNTSYASSVHLFNNYGAVMDIGISIVNYPISENIKDASWYSDLKKLNGYYKLITNGGGFFITQSDQKFISMARLYNDIDTQKEKGALVINVSTESIAAAFNTLVREYNTNIIILDELGNIIVGEGIVSDPMMLINEISTSKNNYVLKDINEEEYMISYSTNEYGWYIIGFLDTNEVVATMNKSYYINSLFLLVTGILIFIGISLFVTYKTNAIKSIVNTMNDTSTGELEVSRIKTNSSDIRNLRDGYNSMVDEINSLIGRIREEEELKSKLELNTLQSQIKPHFLYNTFDSISSLALMGDNESVYQASMALGRFYRTSLSRGKEIITLAEEFETVKSYTEIMSIRYKDTFKVIWDINEDVYDVRVPKLVLQPFVENAIYHGIRPKSEMGIIIIKSDIIDEYILIEIEDDGLGMDSETVEHILNRESDGFGVRSTLQRLKIYYEDNAKFEIRSEKDKGTIVRILIPRSYRG